MIGARYCQTVPVPVPGISHRLYRTTGPSVCEGACGIGASEMDSLGRIDHDLLRIFTMTRCLLSSMTFACLVCFSADQRVTAADKAKLEEGFHNLFDGKSLSGWEGNTKVFRVQDGSIVGGSLTERIAHNEFLCTKKAYRDFELRLQVKFIGENQNGGIQFRSKRIPDHFEVIGYQCDIGRVRGEYIWGALYDESRRRRFLVAPDTQKLEKVLKPDGYNDVTIRCEGPKIHITVNGLTTVDYTESDKKIAGTGIIGVQIHGGPPAQAWYKDIRIKELSPSK